MLQEFCGALRVAGGVAVGEVGDGEDVVEPGVGGISSRSLRPTTAITGTRRGAQCDGGGQLSLQGLVVEPTFAGDDQVGVGDVAGRSSSRSRKYSAPEAVVAPSSMAAKPMPPAAPEPGAWAKRLGGADTRSG